MSKPTTGPGEDVCACGHGTSWHAGEDGGGACAATCIRRCREFRYPAPIGSDCECGSDNGVHAERCPSRRMPEKPTLHFVVNGEDVRVPVGLSDTLRVAAARALHESQNTGRPLNEWEIRDLDGRLLDDQSRATESPPDLFLSLCAGHGASVTKTGGES